MEPSCAAVHVFKRRARRSQVQQATHIGWWWLQETFEAFDDLARDDLLEVSSKMLFIAFILLFLCIIKVNYLFQMTNISEKLSFVTLCWSFYQPEFSSTCQRQTGISVSYGKGRY